MINRLWSSRIVHDIMQGHISSNKVINGSKLINVGSQASS